MSQQTSKIAEPVSAAVEDAARDEAEVQQDSGQDSGQDEQWQERAVHLAHVLGSAYSARYVGRASLGVCEARDVWSVDAGLGNPHGTRRIVARDVATGALTCAQDGASCCCHVGAVLLFLRTHGADAVRYVVAQEASAEAEAEAEANRAIWLRASGWV